MTIEIENQKQYQQLLKSFVEQYTHEFRTKGADAIDLNLFYTKVRNDYNKKLKILQMRFPSGLQEFINDWRYENNSKNNYKNDFELLEMFCTQNGHNLNEVALSKAEFLAIQKVFWETLPEETINNKLKEKIEEIVETLDDFFKRIENEENTFCEAMPLEIPFNHFRVFVEKKNKNGKSYLTRQQFISFIEQAFIGLRPIKKITLDIGSGESGFVIKRFYEFFGLAVHGYESTSHCKKKYMELVSDNFNNWTYERLKNNFTNKTKKDW